MDSLDLVAEFVFELATCLTYSANCFEFCSNVRIAFTSGFDKCLDTSFVCSKSGFYYSRIEKTTLFKSLTASTVLSATLLTNIL